MTIYHLAGPMGLHPTLVDLVCCQQDHSSLTFAWWAEIVSYAIVCCMSFCEVFEVRPTWRMGCDKGMARKPVCTM